MGWTAPDLHGSVAAVLAGSGASISDAFRYDGYGETIASLTSSLPSPWRYQGRLLLNSASQTDLYDFVARAYDPALGAFTGLDTTAGSAQDPITLNRYLYAGADPATLIDPDGHWFGLDDLVASAGGAILGGGTTLVGDLLGGQGIKVDHIVSEATGGAAFGETLLYTANPWVAGGAAGVVSEATQQTWDVVASGGKKSYDLGRIAERGAEGAVTAGVIGKVANVVAPIAGKIAAPFLRRFGEAVDELGSRVSEALKPRVTVYAHTGEGGSRALVPYDPDFAAAQTLGRVSNLTPGGRSLSVHAAQEFMMPKGGRRSPLSLSELDDVLDRGQFLRYDPLRRNGPTILVSTRPSLRAPFVVVDAASGTRIVTFALPAGRGK